MVFCVIFERRFVAAQADTANAYHEEFQSLIKQQNHIGCISHTTYQSPDDKSQLLSLADFETQSSMQCWRQLLSHPRMSKWVEDKIFEDYRILTGPECDLDTDVNALLGDYILTKQRGRFVVIYQQVRDPRFMPVEGQDIPMLVSPTEEEGSSIEVLDGIVHSCVYANDDTILWMSGWPHKAAAIRYTAAIDRTSGDRVRVIRIMRDYGKFDRDEAPGSEPREESA